ncbi:hypothetical protein KKF34_03640 [Myxococcota bacterium]|nr:hypothetical protein [Myxococcota bacterium]MBU1380592.1 hypothetical protein [Myxococcota bacterium]MBU1495948.1 hypothetical protein [Myxococcota bacterium]
MKKLSLIAMLCVAAFFGCDDDDDSNNNTGCTPTSCEEWQTCNETSGICELDAGRCEVETDCETGVTTCNLETHTCDDINQCDCEEWQDCNEDTNTCELAEGRCELETDCETGVTTCNFETHTCDAIIECNTDKTASGVTLPADTCGDMDECIESSDCPEDMRCENLPVDGEDFSRPCCVEGPRGCSTTGDTCVDEFDCDSGLCIGRNDGQTYCTTQCEGPDDCDDPISDCADLFIMMVCQEPAE